MTSIAYSPVSIQTSSQSVPSTPSWFGEATLLAHHLQRHGVLTAIEEQVRFARRRGLSLRGDRFSRRAPRLCDERRTDAGSLLRADRALGKRVHGALWTRSLACTRDAQSLSRLAGSGRSRGEAHPLSPRSARSPPCERGAASRSVGPTGEPLPRLRHRWHARGGEPSCFAQHPGSACPAAAFAPALRPRLDFPQAGGSCAHPHHGLTGSYASVACPFWQSGEWRVPGRTTSGGGNHRRLPQSASPP